MCDSFGNMCDSFGNHGVSGLAHLMNTNSRFENGELIWDKVPKWYYICVAVSLVVIGTGVLYLLGVMRSWNRLVNGSVTIAFGGALFLGASVSVGKRFYNFYSVTKKYKEEGDKVISSLISEKKIDLSSVEAQPIIKIGNTNQSVSLPAEIVQIIFSFLEVKELCVVSKVCKYWNQQSQANALWDRFTQWDFKRYEIQGGDFTSKQRYTYCHLMETKVKRSAMKMLATVREDKISLFRSNNF